MFTKRNKLIFMLSSMLVTLSKKKKSCHHTFALLENIQPTVTVFYFVSDFSMSFQNNPHTLTATRIMYEKTAFHVQTHKHKTQSLSCPWPSVNTHQVWGILHDLLTCCVAKQNFHRSSLWTEAEHNQAGNTFLPLLRAQIRENIHKCFLLAVPAANSL